MISIRSNLYLFVMILIYNCNLISNNGENKIRKFKICELPNNLKNLIIRWNKVDNQEIKTSIHLIINLLSFWGRAINCDHL